VIGERSNSQTEGGRQFKSVRGTIKLKTKVEIMKASVVGRYKVTPYNIKNGQKAPYFTVDLNSSAKKEDVAKAAQEEFKQRSSLSKYSNWSLETEKV
jgi:ribosomal protein S6